MINLNNEEDPSAIGAADRRQSENRIKTLILPRPSIDPGFDDPNGARNRPPPPPIEPRRSLDANETTNFEILTPRNSATISNSFDALKNDPVTDFLLRRSHLAIQTSLSNGLSALEPRPYGAKNANPTVSMIPNPNGSTNGSTKGFSNRSTNGSANGIHSIHRGIVEEIEEDEESEEGANACCNMVSVRTACIVAGVIQALFGAGWLAVPVLFHHFRGEFFQETVEILKKRHFD